MLTKLIAFLTFLILASASLKAVYQPKTDLECPDQEIHDQCLTECRMNYLDCLANCESSYCNSECLLSFQECDASCPCGLECPAGCQDCPEHPLCEDDCEDAQINNDQYRLCLNQAVFQLDVCLKTCPPDMSCHDSCYATYKEQLSDCPCIETQTTTTEVSTATTTTTSTTTTELTPIDPSEVSILVILNDLSASYLTSGDGSSKVAAKISAPSNDYTANAKHALVNGQVHIFGGTTDNRKIAKLNGCAFVELSARLNVDRDSGTEALSIQSGSQALICFNSAGSKSCEIFDGSSAVTTFETTYTHRLGGLGFYQNQPATVGCYRSKHKKAETQTSTGWVALPDHPEALAGHSSIGLDDNSMILLGGTIYGPGYQTGIWKIKENVWSRIGELIQSATYGSAFYTGRSIFFFNGGSSPYPNHRIDLTADEEIKEVVRIGNHASAYFYPVLLETENNRCL
ncbi:unnamed protein product [Oikopleura dioica]|uniref:TNFR-Cys domain-containing protein n=1 Tax=Oikopleura dioica TaxID=34765 RepID=E4XPA4_OIKDI|nr:unnamed protein product [Oikopleura dioica]